ncbi:MAG: site-2 protease family protein [Oscillospiraceae bacterium]|jgi:Zn-dependent protease|nr:site-2 protease family protein [Oscillospiraceae bacterium]
MFSNSSAGVFYSWFLPKAIVIFLIFPVLQYFTCLVACKLGDDSPEMQKRLTFNPLAHMDPLGTVLLLLSYIGWPKPLPINAANFYKVKNRRTGRLFVALAGPAGLLVFAFFFLFAANISGRYFSAIVSGVFQVTAEFSIYISLFSCIPIPGFAGEAIGEYFFPKFMNELAPYRTQICIGFILLISFAPRILTPIFVPIDKVAELIRWLLNGAASGILDLLTLPFRRYS